MRRSHLGRARIIPWSAPLSLLLQYLSRRLSHCWAARLLCWACTTDAAVNRSELITVQGPGPPAGSLFTGYFPGATRALTRSVFPRWVKRLLAAGAGKVFREVTSGAKTDRAQLRRVLSELTAGDVLMVTRLDRLALNPRSVKHARGDHREESRVPLACRHRGRHDDRARPVDANRSWQSSRIRESQNSCRVLSVVRIIGTTGWVN